MAPCRKYPSPCVPGDFKRLLFTAGTVGSPAPLHAERRRPAAHRGAPAFPATSWASRCNCACSGFRSFSGRAARELGDWLREEARRLARSNDDLARRFVRCVPAHAYDPADHDDGRAALRRRAASTPGRPQRGADAVRGQLVRAGQLADRGEVRGAPGRPRSMSGLDSWPSPPASFDEQDGPHAPPVVSTLAAQGRQRTARPPSLPLHDAQGRRVRPSGRAASAPAGSGCRPRLPGPRLRSSARSAHVRGGKAGLAACRGARQNHRWDAAGLAIHSSSLGRAPQGNSPSTDLMTGTGPLNSDGDQRRYPAPPASIAPEQ